MGVILVRGGEGWARRDSSVALTELVHLFCCEGFICDIDPFFQLRFG